MVHFFFLNVMALCQLQWVEEKLRSRKDTFRPFFFDVQSDKNPFFEVFKVSKTKGISFDEFNEIISRFQFGVRIGQLKGVDVPKETAQLLKSMGYEVQLALIATKPKLSYLSTLIRYEELYAINPDQARATPKEHHDFIVNHLVDNTRQLEKLAIFERIQIYQRDRSCVYDSEEDKTSAATVLHDLLFGEWNQVEKEMLKSGEERLKDLTNRNGSQNTNFKI